MKHDRIQSAMTGSKPCSRPLLPRLAYLLLCTLLLTGVSFSRFITGTGADDQARAAAWKVEVTYTGTSSDQTMERPSGDGIETVSYPFTVTSHSETALQYDLEIQLDQSLPDGVTAYLDDEPIPFSEGNNTVYTVSNAGTLAAGSNVSKEHTLSFTGDFDTTISPGTDETIQITITVDAVQID